MSTNIPVPLTFAQTFAHQWAVDLMTMSALGRALLDRAKSHCVDGNTDEWTEETLQLAAKLGAGNVRREPYDPARHGSIDCDPGDLIWTWDSQPRVDSLTPPVESAP